MVLQMKMEPTRFHDIDVSSPAALKVAESLNKLGPVGKDRIHLLPFMLLLSIKLVSGGQ